MSIKKIKKRFTKWAPYYDILHKRGLPFRSDAVQKLKLKRGDEVLDLACGTGLSFEYLEMHACMHAIADGKLPSHWLSRIVSPILIAVFRVCCPSAKQALKKRTLEEIEKLLTDLEVEEHYFGVIYVASGIKS